MIVPNICLKENTLYAVLPEPSMVGLEKKISFNNRHCACISTQLDVVVENGFKLCFSLNPELAAKGLVASNAPGGVTEGPVKMCLVNCGREIVDIFDRDPIGKFWVEPIFECNVKERS